MKELGERFRFTPEILNRAVAMRQQSPRPKWKHVASEIGCDVTSLKITVLHRNQGKWQGGIRNPLRERAYFSELISMGAKGTELARDLQVSRAMISKRFKVAGLDRAARAAIIKKTTREQ